jgi:hypothetical protein
MISYNEWKITEVIGERRFRASIYLDIFVPETDNLEEDREKAKVEAEEIARSIPNSYVGGVAAIQGMTFDREI